MLKNINEMLNNYSSDLKEIFGKNLKKVILYGSYARGDYNDSSDIDIMILVDLNDKQIKKLLDEVSDCTFEINLENDVTISPIIKNERHFKKWVNDLPFYHNVDVEGVVVSA